MQVINAVNFIFENVECFFGGLYKSVQTAGLFLHTLTSCNLELPVLQFYYIM